jgi:A/G-specific adenine glycosylase
MNRNRAIVTALLGWFDKSARDLPWRRARDPYAIWISEIMLQQTQVKTVIPYWERWMRALPTVEKFARAKPETFLKLWEGLGYYTRVHNAQKAACIVVETYRSNFPDKHEDVLALPGIGRYTAGAICSIAFNQPTPILDGNVIRVLARVFAIDGNPKDKKVNARLWQLAEELVLVSSKLTKPARAVSNFNQSLMELGALICTPRSPLCVSCPLQRNCEAYKTNRVGELPVLEKRQTATQRRFVAFVVKKANRWLVQQRPPGVVNAHLWEFPNIEVAVDSAMTSMKGYTIDAERPVVTVRHSITRYRILLEAYEARAIGKARGTWISKAQMQRLAFSSAHRQIADRIG